MNLIDMLNELDMVEESPSAMAQKYAKTSGQSAQQLQRGLDTLGQRTDVASQGAGKLASDMDRLLNSKFAPAVMRMLDALEQSNQVDATGENEDIEEADLNEFTSVGEIDDNLIRLMMDGDPELTTKAKMALSRLDKGIGINKTFTTAIKKLLSHLTDILADGGVAGYKVIDNLHKSMSPEKHAMDQLGTDKKSPPAEVPEPTDQEITDYAKKMNMNVVTDVQKQNVITAIKQLKQAEIDKNPDAEPGNQEEPEGEMKLAASKKYEDQRDELKRLSGMVEAMSDAYTDEEIVAPVQIKTDDQETSGTVTFRQDKSTDKGSVSIEASGEDMQELAKVLKLAGLTLPQDMYKDEPDSDKEDNDHEGHDDIEKDHVEDGETCDCCGNEVVDGECGCGPECPHCGGKPGDLPKDDKVMVLSPKDVSYSTDKEVLVNYIKDKLKKSIS